MSKFFDYIIRTNCDRLVGNKVQIAKTDIIGKFTNPISLQDYVKHWKAFLDNIESGKRFSSLCKEMKELKEKMIVKKKPEYIDEYYALMDKIGEENSIIDKNSKIMSEIEMTGI